MDRVFRELADHMDCVQVKKSSVVKAHSCPQYSQSFHFKLEEEMLDCSSISVIVYEVRDGVKDTFNTITSLKQGPTRH